MWPAVVAEGMLNMRISTAMVRASVSMTRSAMPTAPVRSAGTSSPPPRMALALMISAWAGAADTSSSAPAAPNKSFFIIGSLLACGQNVHFQLSTIRTTKPGGQINELGHVHRHRFTACETWLSENSGSVCHEADKRTQVFGERLAQAAGAELLDRHGLAAGRPVRVRGPLGPMGIGDGGPSKRHGIRTQRQDGFCLVEGPDRAGSQNCHGRRNGLPEPGQGMSTGILRGVGQRLPQRQVDEVHALRRQPPGHLEAFIQVQTTRVAPVLGREANA